MHSAPSRGSVGPLLLGLVLGALLILAFTTLVEVAAGKSLLGLLGVKAKRKRNRSPTAPGLMATSRRKPPNSQAEERG